MLAKTMDVASIIVAFVVVVASIVLMITWRRFFKRVYENQGIDTTDQKRTAWRIFAVSATVGICIAVVGIGMSMQSRSDSESVTIGAALLAILFFGGGSGLVSILQFFSTCRLVRIRYGKKNDRSDH